MGRRPFAPFALLTLLALASACRRRNEKPDDDAPPQPAPNPSATTFALLDDAADVGVDAPPSHAAPVAIDVALAGDAIPQVKVLANTIADVMSHVPSCWKSADARVFNLEAPIGERKGLPGDKTLLAFASPPQWFSDLNAASRASAFVVANNHSCDLGPQGLADTVNEAQKLGVKVIGADGGDPWQRVDVVEKDGRRVCVVAWTTFLNDKGRKQQGCLEGSAGAKVARAELSRAGLDLVHEKLSSKGRWDGCDARIAFVHGGREYKPQIRPVMEQAEAAAAYVDAVIVSHPHVPDLVEAIAAPAPKGDPQSSGGRAVGRAVPVYRSLGNFISNQGIAWTLGMSVDLLSKDGVPDPIRTVWTRVSMIARLHFEWDSPANGEPTAPSTIKYGYTLAFTDRSGEGMIDIRLRPLPNGEGDAVAAKLRRGPKPFGALIDAPCRVDQGVSPTCDAGGAVTPTVMSSSLAPASSDGRSGDGGDGGDDDEASPE